MAAALN